MSVGLQNLRHIVVLMLENRSFDHMLGSLKAVDSRIDGITSEMSNPDTTGAPVKAQPLAEFQGQLNPDPDHHFPAVDLQIFGEDANANASRVPIMQGFVKSYFNQRRDVAHSQKIMGRVQEIGEFHTSLHRIQSVRSIHFSEQAVLLWLGQ